MPTFFGRRYMRKVLQGTTEIYIGICILLLVSGICTALVVHAPKPATPLFETPAELQQPPTTASSKNGLLPPLGASGWSPAQDLKTFSRNTLYEKINGGADVFFMYGFVQLTFAKYVNQDNPDLDIQVYLYDMGTPENARDIYQYEAPPQPAHIEVGAKGYASGASVYFYLGKLYVNIMGAEQSSADLCVQLAHKIAATINNNEP